MNADAEAIIEQALRFVLDEQAKLLARPDVADLTEALKALNRLALSTEVAIANGIARLKSADKLIKEAREVETLCDDLSEKVWRFIPVPVCSVFEKLERALHPREDKYGAAVEIRSHYQSMRVRLLEQTLGARLLESNSDLGLEMERNLATVPPEEPRTGCPGSHGRRRNRLRGKSLQAPGRPYRYAR